MKAYTDLEQSKKLAEILPLETADMYYISGDKYDICFGNGTYEEIVDWYSDGRLRLADIPCWSLTALLGWLPSTTLDSSNDHHYRLHCMKKYTEWHDNAIDACCEMILKLKEKNLL